MTEPSLEDLCELGQEQLMETRYLQAEATLLRAEVIARQTNDWDRLSRLYMPLQEARRQRRQRCGEGTVHLGLIASGPTDTFDPECMLDQYPHGQLLVAGWGTLQPAKTIRALAAERGLYVETFLAAVFPAGNAQVVVIAPFADSELPKVGTSSSIAELSRTLPAGCLVLSRSDLPGQPEPGTATTYARVMAIWERLHAPFLAQADAESDLLKKVELYRRAIDVDYACELAHQRLSAAARELSRGAAGQEHAPSASAATCAYIAIGANLGDRAGTIRAALNRLAEHPQITIAKLSSIIDNPAVGGPPDSPPFLNGVVEVQTTLSPRELLDVMLRIERSLGRERHRKWDPRTIDLDLLLYDDRIIDEPDLSVPHPRMHERSFVLVPLAEIAGQRVHPRLGRTFSQLLAELPGR